MTTKSAAAAVKLKNIRKAYIKQLPAQLQGIRASYAEFVLGEQGNAPLEDLHRRIHSLKGASASFRMSMLSAVATAGEHLAKEALQSATPPDRSWHQKMQEHFARMEYEISTIDPMQGMELQVQELAIAAEGTPGRERKVVYLCDDDRYQRLTLETQISCFGFEILSFGEPEQLATAVRAAPPDVIVMDMIFPDRPLGGSDIMQTIQSGRENPIPTVFISTQGSIDARLSAVRAGSSAYFVKPLNVTELCFTLSQLTTSLKPEPYRIMIIDDDPQLAEYHALILEESGMMTLTVNDPLQVMSPLIEFKPDLILMDMYMPGYNGMELAKAIRQIGSYFCVPIVYLSSETDTDKQFAALQTGGDEFLTKPIKPERLVSSVVVRAERMKIIRSLMVRDSMTGLYNHTATKEHLDTAIAHAQRKQEELCFAMIDLDKFKSVNDTYGHPLGDRVLITLARLISQRVRKQDIVGRFGGEEFAVILPDCSIANAIQLLNELRESFAAIRFQAKDETFSCTFSCGVAQLSVYGDSAAINAGADEALYAAKYAGRNMVLVSGEL
ncbi:response regulator PleD [Geobacter sp. OR-1]|uniref:diguanylate cyclase n=1 Tax=Geobacter sp. OR-1 TaxID=1266765 RepID=UPI0005425A05|nr:diguanylate cyclase [Geobacter sp. OR-1]GAM09093.1 response regulator PleD [Geobacter sp. OR-1]